MELELGRGLVCRVCVAVHCTVDHYLNTATYADSQGSEATILVTDSAIVADSKSKP